MTISNQTSRTGPYNGNGSTTVFAYDFRILDQAHIVVTLKDAANVETVQTLTTNYTVSGVEAATGGNITMNVAPASGQQLTFSRAVPQTQEVDLANRGGVQPEVLESAYDKLTQLSQDKVELLNRMPRFPVSSALTDVELPLTLTANTALVVNAAGTGYTTGPTTSQISSAESSANAAAASAAAAAASYDSFDDRYLGAKSSAPSTDNDGAALLTGALYFNSSTNVMNAWTGSAWVLTTPTSSDQTAINTVNANASNINTVSGISGNVTTVAGISADVSTVAADGTDIGVVSGISANVTKVANIDSDVSAVAAIDSDVAAVENIAANVTTVAGVASNVTTVAGVASNVTTVAGVAANVTTVAGIAANTTTVAGISGDVTTVAGISGDVSSVAAQVVGYDFSTTTTMGDPGAGNVRFNHATLASVSAIAIDDVDKNGVDQSAFIILWDDSTNTIKGTLVCRTAGGDVATFLITDLTDNSGWSQIAVTHVASSGTFSNGEDTFFGFSRAGDKGLDGEGSGDVIGPASATDNAVVRYNSTTGKLLQNSGVTIDDSGDILLPDNAKALFGASFDLQIYHDGSNSFIDDAGTGVLSIRSNSISLGKYTGENIASFVADGAVTLYYDNAAKLATASTGVAITGDITANNFAGKNRIINGNGVINQRGAVTGASNVYFSDRWLAGQAGACVVNANTVSGYLELDVTTADASIAAGDALLLQQPIEGYNVADLLIGTASAKTITISFKHKHTKTGINCVFLRNSATNRSYVFEYTQSVSDTEETHTETIALDTTGTWLTTTGAGLFVSFCAMAGSTFQTTKDAWRAGNYFATASQVNNADSASNYFRITDVQVELGSVATEFEYEDVGTTLAKCQRYYQRFISLGSCWAKNTAEVMVTMPMTPELRATGTASLIDSTPTIQNGNTSYTSSGTTLTNTAASSKSHSFYMGGFTGLTAYHEFLENQATPIWQVDAEL